MTSQKPYLLRALYEWIVDNGLTPYVLVRVASASVKVPPDYVKDGQIVLNVAPAAVRNLVIDNDMVVCDGRFGGQAFPISVPMNAVMAIYSKETSEGMMFDAEGGDTNDTLMEPAADAERGPVRAHQKGAHLKVIK